MAIKFIETKIDKKITRRDILIGFSAILAIAISFLFPQKAYGETFWLSLSLFAVFPALVIGFILKEPLQNFGLSRGKMRTGISISILVIALFIAVNYYLIFHSKYGGQLSIARFALNGFAAFFVFEIFISLPLHFFWEFFFRGFIQLGLEKKLGIFSLVLAAGLQTILSFRGSWPVILLVLFSSIAAGIIVSRSRSILYSALSLWLISVSLDIMIIRMVRQIAG